MSVVSQAGTRVVGAGRSDKVRMSAAGLPDRDPAFRLLLKLAFGLLPEVRPVDHKQGPPRFTGLARAESGRDESSSSVWGTSHGHG